MSLDDLLGAGDGEPVRERRGRLAARTFALAVVAAVVLVVLAGLLLWALGSGAAFLWSSWWDDLG